MVGTIICLFGWMVQEVALARGMLLGMAGSNVMVSECGRLADGRVVTLYTVRSGGLEAGFIDYGARIVSLKVPDKTGAVADVVLGYGSLELYVADKTYSGAVVGRLGNRLAGGRFVLDGVEYQVPLNNGPNALHGGPEGFDKRIWKATALENGVEMVLVSPDGDQGFPGNLTVTVRYLVEGMVLRVEYLTTTDKTTVVNVTNHAYFNLAGERSETILEHTIMLPAARFTPVNETLIPTGELAHVGGTPLDFQAATRIGERIEAEDVQLKRAGGYDHNWAMGKPGEMKVAAVLTDPASGRVMTVKTTEPGVQFYSGNFIDGTMPNRVGGVYKRRAGLCLETQHYPDTPNQRGFPSVELRVGEERRSVTEFGFGV